MLALTHHVIVKAAVLCKKRGFIDYCVLGDDVVIRDDAVAKAYLTIMSQLGVSKTCQSL
jgi:hypothetical protein